MLVAAWKSNDNRVCVPQLHPSHPQDGQIAAHLISAESVNCSTAVRHTEFFSKIKHGWPVFHSWLMLFGFGFEAEKTTNKSVSPENRIKVRLHRRRKRTLDVQAASLATPQGFGAVRPLIWPSLSSGAAQDRSASLMWKQCWYEDTDATDDTKIT